jgi:hypothetical protein
MEAPGTGSTSRAEIVGERTVTVPDVYDDAPLTLKEACDLFFRGRITPATLRAEARRGTLQIMPIGRADFVTPSAVRVMMSKCQGPQKELGSISIKKTDNGSSATDRSRDALAAAKQIGQALKKHSGSTSPRNSNQSPAKMIPLNSPSRKS